MLRLLAVLLIFTCANVGVAHAKCTWFQKSFSLGPDLGFGDRYRKSLSENFKDYGVCVVKKSEGHPTRLGNKSLRFEIKTGDCGWGKDNKWSDCKNDRARHELSGNYQNDGEYWYTWSLYLPEDFQLVFPTKLAMSQFHQQKSHPVWMFQNVSGGYYVDDQVVGITAHMRKIINHQDMLGAWNDILINANFTHEETGFFKVWVNGKLVFEHHGKTKRKDKQIYHKFGLYQSFLSRYRKAKNVEDVPGQVAYFDEIRRATSCAKLRLDDLGYDCDALIKQ